MLRRVAMKPLKPGMSEARKRVKKAHSKAKSSTFFYMMGSLILLVLSFLQSLNVSFMGENQEGSGIMITNFFKPITAAIDGNLDVVSLIVMALYIIVIVVTFICFIKCAKRHSSISRRGAANILFTNDNTLSMDEAGDYFSAAFATFIINSFLIYMISGAIDNGEQAALGVDFFATLTITAYIGLVVGLLVHFIGGCIAGGASTFAIDATIDEKKRETKVCIFFFRNLVQVIATGAILFFFSPASTVYLEVAALVSGGESALLDFSNIMGVATVALQLLTMVWLVVLIKHATADTEYNRDGMDGPGMCVFRVFSVFTVITCAALFFLDKANGEWIFNYAFAAGTALVAFVLDLIIKPKKAPVEDDGLSEPFVDVDELQFNGDSKKGKKQKNTKKEKKGKKAKQEEEEVFEKPETGKPPMPPYGYPYPYMLPPMMYPPCAACKTQQPVANPGRPLDPNALYVSEQERRRLNAEGRGLRDTEVELRYAEQQNKVNKKNEKRNAKKAKKVAKKEAKFAKTLDEVEPIEEEKPVETPVSDTIDLKISIPKALFPQSAPVQAPVLPPVEENVEETEDELPMMLNVKCPTCGKKLSVKSNAAYHRCPACGKVFQIRKGKKAPTK